MINKKVFTASYIRHSKATSKSDVVDTKATECNQEIDKSEDDPLVAENARLKAKIKALEDEINTKKKEAEDREKVNILYDKLGEMGVDTKIMKSLLAKDIDLDSLPLEDGTVKGLDEVLKSKVAGDWSELFADEEAVEAVGGHEEPDGDEAGYFIENPNPVPVGEMPDGDEGKIMRLNKSSTLKNSVGVHKQASKPIDRFTRTNRLL